MLVVFVCSVRGYNNYWFENPYISNVQNLVHVLPCFLTNVRLGDEMWAFMRAGPNFAQ